MNVLKTIASIALLCCAIADPGHAAVPFATVKVAYEVAPRERIWDGRIEAVNQATVSAQTSGRIAELPFDVNDFVEAGSVIMRFTDTEQRAALARAEAALEEAQARSRRRSRSSNASRACSRTQPSPKRASIRPKPTATPRGRA